MKEFQTTKLIFNDLKSFEVKELRKRIQGSLSIYDNSKISLQYLDVLANNIELSADTAQYKLYNKLNVVAFRKLNQRLLSKMFDILSSKDIIEFNEQYDERSKEIFILEKKLMMVDLLRFRGIFSVSDGLLNQIIYSGKMYENYEILIFALQKKRLWLPGTNSILEKDGIDKEIIKYQKYSLSLSYTKKIYTDLILMHNNSEAKNIVTAYKNGIRKVETISKKIHSLTLNFYSSQIKAQYLSLIGRDDEAAGILIKLTEAIKNSLVFTKNRVGTILLNIALYKRNCYKFSEAQMYLTEATKFLSRIDETKVVLYYQNAVFNFIVGDLIKSQYFIKLLTSLDTTKLDVRLKNRIYYFFLLNLFVQGKSKEAFEHIEKIKNHFKHNVGLEIEMKILQIMISIDLEQYDKVDRLLEVYRKKPVYIANLNLFPFSIKPIFILFNSLRKVGYDFNSLTKKDMNLYEKFSEDYNLKGDFLIPFTPWFKSKLKNVPYDHSAAMREMRKNYKAEKYEMA